MLTTRDDPQQPDAHGESMSGAQLSLRRASKWVDSRADELQGLSGGVLVGEVVRGWRTLCCVLGISILGALIFVAFAQKTYTATVLVQPSMLTMQQNNGLESGGLALLKGLSGADLNSTVTPYMRFINELNAHSVAARMQQKFGVLQVIYAAQWDSRTKEWRKPTGTLVALKTRLKSMLGFPERPAGPDADDLVRFINRHLSISPVGKSSIRRIEFHYKDKTFALAFLTELVTETDGVIRSDVRATASAYVAYLSDAMGKARSTEVRAGLAQLMIQQQQRLMMINSHQPFAEAIIDGPYVSSKPTSPQPVLALALSLVVGILVSALIFVRRALRRAQAN